MPSPWTLECFKFSFSCFPSSLFCPWFFRFLNVVNHDCPHLGHCCALPARPSWASPVQWARRILAWIWNKPLFPSPLFPSGLLILWYFALRLLLCIFRGVVFPPVGLDFRLSCNRILRRRLVIARSNRYRLRRSLILSPTRRSSSLPFNIRFRVALFRRFDNLSCRCQR